MDKFLKGPEVNFQTKHNNLGKIIYQELSSFEEDYDILIDIENSKTITRKAFLKEWLYNVTYMKNLSSFRRGETIAIISESSWRFVLTLLAAFSLGAPAHLINPDYTINELIHLLKLSKPKIVFCSESALKKVQFLQNQFHFEIVKLEEGFEGDHEDQDFFIDVEGEETAVICNSSGTTGLPKGVEVTHRALTQIKLYQTFEEFALVHENQSQLLFVPLFHLYGVNILISGLLTNKVRTVILGKFKPQVFLKTLESYKINTMCLVPTVINFLANYKTEGYDLSSLEDVRCAAAPCNLVDFQKVQKKFGIAVRNLYGMTECCTSISVMPLGSRPNGSVGKVYPNRIVKVCDSDGQAQPSLKKGEIMVKNPTFKSYLSNSEKTNETFDPEGFVRTGDIGYYDEDGFLYIVDRIKDVIKFKSFQVCPSELESILFQHEGVKDVAVVGKPHERFGELPVAFVVKHLDVNLTEEDVRKYLDQFVSDYKKLHEVFFIDALPKNITGKVLKNELKQMLN